MSESSGRRVTRKDLSWYAEQIERGQPFSSLLYGDGEFQVMADRRTGQTYTNYKEQITPQLRDELLASLDVRDENVYHASDEFLLDWTTYGGNDKAMVREVSENASRVLDGRPEIPWYDGTIWDVAVREGKLGPILKAINGLKYMPVLVGCSRLTAGFKGFDEVCTVTCPDTNAAGSIGNLVSQIIPYLCYPRAVVVCCGLSAIPLIMSLRRRNPECIYLDLGSVLDVFVGLGGERGWRRELYEDKERWDALVAKNLEGL